MSFLMSEYHITSTDSKHSNADSAVVSPVEFLKGIFGEVLPDAEAQPLLCGFPDDPGEMQYWIPTTIQGGKLSAPIKPDNNCFFNMATFVLDKTAKYRAKRENISAVYVILLDDLGTKSSVDVKLPLSFLVETSPGNFQGGLILDYPCKDLKLYESVVKALGIQGLSDPGASGAARWARLPYGRNTKAKYLVDGVAPQVRLAEFHPERRYSLEQIMEAFDLKLDPVKCTVSGKDTTSSTPTIAADNPFAESGEGGRTLKIVRIALTFLRKGLSPEETIFLCLAIDEIKHHPPLESTHPGKVKHTVLDVYERYIVQEIPDFVIELNFDHFVAREGGKTVVCREDYDPVLKRNVLVRSSFQDFKNFFLNTLVPSVDKHGKPILIPLGQAWLTAKKRRQYKGIRMTPLIDDPSYYNLWKGYTVQPVKGDWHLMKSHILIILCAGNSKLFDYVMGWLARMIQQPGSPGETVLALQGGRGTGKGIFGNAIYQLHGQHACHITNGKHVTGNFNSHLEDCIFLFADEAFWAGDKAAENVLKGLITEPVTPIERKFGDLKHATNMLHILMASNNDWIVPAGLDERRYCVLKVSDSKAGDFSYFKALKHEIDNGGLAAMLYELQEMDISSFNVRDVPKTPGLLEQKLHSMEPVQAWWYQKLQMGEISPYYDWPLIPTAQAYEDYTKTVSRMSTGIWKLSETAFGMAFNKLLPDGWPKKKKLKSVNMYESKPVNHYVLPDLDLCREYFEGMIGSKLPWDDTHLEIEIMPSIENDDL